MQTAEEKNLIFAMLKKGTDCYGGRFFFCCYVFC